MTTALELHRLGVRVGPHTGLRNMTVSVQSGECLALIGAPGVATSALLRTIAGLQPAAGGPILVNGVNVTAHAAERRGIVYVHPEPVLFPHLSALRNVAFPLQVRGESARRAEVRAAHWLERLLVSDVADARVPQLSITQRFRVALARALCADPVVLLLDEPLASPDPGVRRDVRAALQTVRNTSLTATLLATRDLDDALSVATQVMTLSPSGSSEPLTPAALLHAPPSLDSARLLGVYAELDGVVLGDGEAAAFHWLGGAVPTPGAPPGPAIACVRSHDVHVHTSTRVPGPALTVLDRIDASHEVTLTVRRVGGDTAVLRTGLEVSAHPGDVVRVSIRRARCFATS